MQTSELVRLTVKELQELAKKLKIEEILKVCGPADNFILAPDGVATAAKLNQQKKSAQDDIEQLTVLAKGFGLINNQT